jgi:hypothetical protein
MGDLRMTFKINQASHDIIQKTAMVSATDQSAQPIAMVTIVFPYNPIGANVHEHVVAEAKSMLQKALSEI